MSQSIQNYRLYVFIVLDGNKGTFNFEDKSEQANILYAVKTNNSSYTPTKLFFISYDGNFVEVDFDKQIRVTTSSNFILFTYNLD